MQKDTFPATPRHVRPLPPVLAERYGTITPGAGVGAIVKGTKLGAPLEAE